MAMTPMMLQYLEIKEQYKDAILFYRLGDFYEMFFDDAITASKELELTLTGRSCGEEERAPMCGVPFHSADGYIGRLVAKGYKVVVCEQMEDPATAKGLVKRDIIRIVTPGTIIDNNQLDSTKNNFTVAICFGEEDIALSFADISTGEITASLYKGEKSEEQVINALSAFNPREVISNVSLSVKPSVFTYVTERLHAYCSGDKSHLFDLPSAMKMFEKQFGRDLTADTSVKSNSLISSVGALLSYIAETQLTDINNICKINIQESDQYLDLDSNARRNLELCETMRTNEKRGTLLWVIDKTSTAAGARLLRRWVEQPLVDVNKIVKRQNAVKEFCDNFEARNEISENLRHFLDLDRLMTKLVYGTANAKDLRAISQTVSHLPAIKAQLASFSSDEVADIYKRLDCLDDIRELIDRAIEDDPPFSLREGGFIRRGYNKTVDELYTIVHDAKGFLSELEEREKAETGIKNLKISHNNVFGYYIEVTKSMLSLVPDRYIRKQTLVGAERFITEELKEKETLISGAYDKLVALEYELFCEIRNTIAGQLKRVQETAYLVSKTDCYISLAEVAVKNSYVCPEVDYDTVISIKDGRHPVVEQFIKNGLFVPNDTKLDIDYNRFMIITGPNMAGKSTYMRQTALIVILAQIGSFVPASEARIGIVDKIFTRVGASDDLASGTSTFMLEMNEVAYILKNATQRSLVIYDEIGRGTSTFDGMSIARAVAEYTCKKIGCKSMFATHYHELIELENEMHGVVNYNIAAKKKTDDIIFLRKIVRGGTDDSYGIEVAKLAGVPNEIIKRAREILKDLDDSKFASKPKIDNSNNISIEDIEAAEIRKKLSETDVNLLTPMEALNLLAELVKMAK